jgi:hypothetical protein
MISRRNFIGATAGTAALAQSKPPAARLRGIMLDAARLPESIGYYHRFIDFCSQWGYNAILFRLTDDQGCAMRFESHPELMTHANALSAREAADLAGYAQRRGIMLIPEVESFGHTRFITAVPRYAAFEDGDPARKGFGGICPVHPEAIQIVQDLYREASRVFPAPYFHGGCDEVNWGYSERSRQAIAAASREKVWAGYVNSLAALARSLGKEFIIWGDVVAHKEPAILPLLDKSAIVMDWQYYVTDPAPLHATAQALMEDGRRVMGAAAIISCKWGPRCSEEQLRNIDAFADAYASLEGAANLGVVITNWMPTRYIARSMWDTYAYGGAALRRGGAYARASAFPAFVRQFYGTKWRPAWEDVFAAYYRAAPARRNCAARWHGPILPNPWATDKELHAVLGEKPGIVPELPELRSKIAALEPSVRRNAGDFSAFALSAEYLEHLYWRDAAVRSKPEPAVLETIARRDAALTGKLEAEWNVSRPPDSPGKRETLLQLGPQDQLLFRMRQAAEYSAEAARDPERLRQVL